MRIFLKVPLSFLVLLLFLNAGANAQKKTYIFQNLRKISLQNPYSSANSRVGNWHPSVVYFKNGWGKNKQKYWMAWTPNIVGDSKYENPCIAYSNDGLNWDTLNINNPIADTPLTDYNADTELFYNELKDTLYCTWKCSNGITYVKQSGDGFNWGSKVFNQDSRILKGMFFYDGKKNYKINPVVTVQNDQKQYYLYIRLGRDYLENLGLYRWTMDYNFNSLDSINVEMENNPKNINCWHFNVFRDPRDKYYYLITDGAINNESVFGNSYVWLAKSTDTLGTKFVYYDKPLVYWGGWYKASAILENNILSVWLGNVDGHIYYDSINFDYLLSWLNNSTLSDDSSTVTLNKRGYSLYNIFPNPIKNNVQLQYFLSKPEYVKIVIYDILGNIRTKLVDEYEEPGEHIIKINQIGLSSGTYLVNFNINNFLESKKILIVK